MTFLSEIKHLSEIIRTSTFLNFFQVKKLAKHFLTTTFKRIKYELCTSKEKLELFEDKNLGFPNLMGELISR